jgi:class 3 adenylate cyclase
VKNLIPHFIQEQHFAGVSNGSFEAYAMFVDMSGFTRLTETLLKEGTAGAERLSDILNAIFEPMVSLVYRHGGFIPYFAGDAFIGIFPVETCACHAPEVLAHAERMFELLDAASPQFKEFQIGIKTGLSFGRVEWGIVGNKCKSFFFRGPAIEGCANSQSQASQHQIIVDEAFLRRLPASTVVSPCPAGRYFLVKEAVPRPNPSPHPSVELPDIHPEVLSLFLPKTVIEFNQRGEFRTVVSVFILRR